MFVKITPIKFKKQADTNISYGLIGIDKIKVKIGNDEFLLNQTHIKKWQDEIRKNINQFEVLYKFQFEHSFQIVSKLQMRQISLFLTENNKKLAGIERNGA